MPLEKKAEIYLRMGKTLKKAHISPRWVKGRIEAVHIRFRYAFQAFSGGADSNRLAGNHKTLAI